MALLLVALPVHAAQAMVPLPRPRPVSAAPAPDQAQPKPENGTGAPQEAEAAPAPSLCRLALTEAVAVAPSIAPIDGPGACGGPDLVRLEAIVLPDRSRVVVKPAAILRCEMAAALVAWAREDLMPLARSAGTALLGIDNFDSFSCRGRNRVAGAKLSEHGRANALDIRALNFAGRAPVSLTDSAVPRDLREKVRSSLCARFKTVLGPGSDGYHENHIHLDLAPRRSDFRICKWNIETEPPPQVAAAQPQQPQQQNAAADEAEEPEAEADGPAPQSLQPPPSGGAVGAAAAVPLPRPRPVMAALSQPPRGGKPEARPAKRTATQPKAVTPAEKGQQKTDGPKVEPKAGHEAKPKVAPKATPKAEPPAAEKKPRTGRAVRKPALPSPLSLVP